MNASHDARWERILAYNLDAPDSQFTLTQRIALENNWTPDYTARVILEYKKFAYLSVVAGHTVSPSDEVDQVWHTHLLYTQEYWNNFCPNILGKELHHGPSKGGHAEDVKHDDWYTKTLTSYLHFFSTQPPADIWPTNTQRFAHKHPVRIDLMTHLVINISDFPLVTRITRFFLNISLFFKKFTTKTL